MKWIHKIGVCLFFSFLVSSFAYSAAVKKISKKRGLLLIDEGSSTDFEKGTKVYIYNSKDKKVAAGIVALIARKKKNGADAATIASTEKLLESERHKNQRTATTSLQTFKAHSDITKGLADKQRLHIKHLSNLDASMSDLLTRTATAHTTLIRQKTEAKQQCSNKTC